MFHCFKMSCDKTQSYNGKAKSHLTLYVHEHLPEKSAVNEHICSCEDYQSISINNFYILSQAKTYFGAKIKEALLVKI